MNLTKRRAEFVYEAMRLGEKASQSPIVPVPWLHHENDFRTRFIAAVARQTSPDRSESPEELHESWKQSYLDAGWVSGKEYDREKRIHPDLVPYSELGRLKQEANAVFVALCEIARLFFDEFEEPERPVWRN